MTEIGAGSGGDRFYAPRKKVYPQAVHGRYRRIKWALMVVALLTYYLTPFIRWNRGEHLPNQAVLIDMPARRSTSSS